MDPFDGLAEEEDPDAWLEDANCRNVGPSIFFPEKGDKTEAARAFCEVCTVRSKCLDSAILNRESGVWGGEILTEGKVQKSRAEKRYLKNLSPPNVVHLGPRIQKVQPSSRGNQQPDNGGTIVPFAASRA